MFVLIDCGWAGWLVALPAVIAPFWQLVGKRVIIPTACSEDIFVPTITNILPGNVKLI
jgi:hypothetical protein